MRTLALAAALLAATAAGTLAQSPNGVRTLNPPSAIKVEGTWSLGARASDFVFVAGMQGVDPATSKLVEGAEDHIRQAFLNIELIAESEGATLQDCVRLTVYVSDLARIAPLVDKVQAELWGKPPYPPRTMFEAKRLFDNDIVEIDSVFYTPAKKSALPLGDPVDLDQCVARQVGDADAGSCRPRALWKEAGIDLVHGVVVALEVRQEHPDAQHLPHRQAEPFKHAPHVAEGPVGLRPDALGQRLGRVVEVAAELAGQEDEAVGLGRVAAGRNGLGKAVEDVKFGSAHRLLDHTGAASGRAKTRNFRPFTEPGTHWYGPPRRGRGRPFCRSNSTTYDDPARLRGRDMKILTGNSNRPLAEAISAKLALPLVKANVRRFSDNEIFVEILENVRGEDMFVLQSTSFPANDHLMELLITIDALRRSSARRITAVMPYFGYARQDRRTGPRTPISAKLVANLLTHAGASRVLTLDLHAAQIQGFFDIPVDNLFAGPLFGKDIKDTLANRELTVVSPDVGGVVRARAVAKRIDADLAIIDKRREQAGVSEVMNVIGDVKNRDCILIDDIVNSAGTLCNAAVALMDQGAKSVSAYVTHGVLSGGAVARVAASPMEKMVITNSIQPTEAVRVSPNVRPLSIATLMAEAIKRISEETSVSSLFD